MANNGGVVAWTNTMYIFVAASTLVLYDHLITIDREISSFWTGKWNVSRLLFFSVRYLPTIKMIIIMFDYFGDVGFHTCGILSYVVFVLGIFTLLINEAALAMRVWYLFTRKRFMQKAIVVLTVVCMIFTVALVAGTPDTQPQDVPATCDYANNPQTEWRMFLPPVVLHVILYGLTLFQMLSISGEIREFASMMIDEGAHLYLLSTLALLYGLIGTTMPDNANAFYPACYSALVQVVMSVAVSRAMLILRNLAAKLHVDPGWLLSYSELSRINYRLGLHDGELLVEMQTGAGDMLDTKDCNDTSAKAVLA